VRAAQVTQSDRYYLPLPLLTVAGLGDREPGTSEQRRRAVIARSPGDLSPQRGYCICSGFPQISAAVPSLVNFKSRNFLQVDDGSVLKWHGPVLAIGITVPVTKRIGSGFSVQKEGLML
jgi:hypothetical protein